MKSVPRWLARVVLAVGALKIIAGIAALAWGQAVAGVGGAGLPIPPVAYAAHLLTWSCVALVLLIGGRADRRAEHLGAIFLLTGSTFADSPLLGIAPTLAPWASSLATAATHVHPVAFLPTFGWMLASRFPVAVSFGPRARVARAGVAVSLVAGVILSLAALFSHLAASNGWMADAAAVDSWLWLSVGVLQMSAFVFMVWQVPLAAVSDKRRVTVFVAGFVIGAVPMLVYILLVELVPGFLQWAEGPAVRNPIALLRLSFFLAVPVTAAYSVTVDRVFDVRLVIRRAVQYALARSTLLALFGIPVAWSIAYVYLNRGLPVGQLLGAHPFVIIAIAAAALLAFRGRTRVLDALNRRFFREQYDAQRILATLVDLSRRASDARELTLLLGTEIDRALHVDGVVVMIADPATRALRSPLGAVRPVAMSSALVELVASDSTPLDIDVASPSSPGGRLPESDRQWLADAGCRLAVPLLASDGALVGMLALGEKKSELPFSREDRSLLSAIAASGALTLENRLHRSAMLGDTGGRAADRSPTDNDRPASECTRCAGVYADDVPACPACGGRVRAAPIPLELLGKFRLERRVGAGAMGIVYRATDLTLNRPVALKTMPHVAPEYAMRLRREARAMAAIAHPNLATIYGAESWRGTPVLIIEFLEGGTLADQLRGGPLPVDLVLAIGIALGGALDKTHAAGVLHRDIKPSNIGFSAEGVPKLLDFGLARLAARLDANPDGADLAAIMAQATDADLTHSRELVGTIPYLSPEALRFQPADPKVDLWSLTLVLFEAIAGRNPVAHGDAFHTIATIATGRIPRLDTMALASPPRVVAFFEDALALDASRRPSTARELCERLQALQDGLADGEMRGRVAATT